MKSITGFAKGTYDYESRKTCIGVVAKETEYLLDDSQKAWMLAKTVNSKDLKDEWGEWEAVKSVVQLAVKEKCSFVMIYTDNISIVKWYANEWSWETPFAESIMNWLNQVQKAEHLQIRIRHTSELTANLKKYQNKAEELLQNEIMRQGEAR